MGDIGTPVMCRVHNKRELKYKKKWEAASSCGVDEDNIDESNASNHNVDTLPVVVKVPYRSQCKVLLVGVGADEQLAGYGRHKAVHTLEQKIVQDEAKGRHREAQAVGLGGIIDTAVGSHESLSAAMPSLLEQELDKDVTRLWKRNLGR